MPRPNRAHGRPDTRVIPTDWGRTHSPVIAASANGRGAFTRPSSGTPATVNADLSIEPGTAPPPVYDNLLRLQMAGAKEAHDIVGDQDEVTTVYLAQLLYDADVQLGDLLQMSAADDPTLLVPRPMPVVRVGRGTDRFSRDVWVVDRLNPTT